MEGLFWSEEPRPQQAAWLPRSLIAGSFSDATLPRVFPWGKWSQCYSVKLLQVKMWVDYDCLQNLISLTFIFLEGFPLITCSRVVKKRKNRSPQGNLGSSGEMWFSPTKPGPEQNLHSSTGTSLRAIALEEEAQSIPILFKGQEALVTHPEICLKLPVK